MKRFFSVFLIAWTLFLFCGCEEGAPTNDLQERMNTADEASSLARTVTLTCGDTVLFEETAVYTRSGTGASLTCSIRSLNSDMTAEALYEETSYTVSITTADMVAALRPAFDWESAEIELTDTNAAVTAQDAARFLMTDRTDMGALAMTIDFVSLRPVSCRISYPLASGNSVEIVFSFTY